MAEPNAFPELVFQHSHKAGFDEPKTFEDTLRDLIRSSPYLVISIVVHALILIAFATAPASVQPDKGKTITATPETVQEPIPPPPPPPPPEVEQVDKIIEDPTVSEIEATDTTEQNESYDLLQGPVGEADSGNNDIIGVGGGGLAGGGGGGKFGHRGKGGGGKVYNEAVDNALKWLANHQTSDGYWSCAAFDLECGKQGDDTVCDGPGLPRYDVGVTGIALLAFLGANNTHKTGKWKTVVRNGLRYLADIQQPDGNFGNANNSEYTYDHIISTLVMIEAYALTKDHLFKRPAEKGLAYMFKIRNPGAAWRYGPNGSGMDIYPNDMSVTGWAIMAMTSAKEAGLEVDQQAWEDSFAFLEEMTDSEGVTGYYEKGGRPPRPEGRETLWPSKDTESMTAVGVLCRIFMDPEQKRPGNKAMVDKGVAIISRLPPVWSDDLPGRRDFYFWYYGSYALFQVGGKPWKDWEKTLIDAIAKHQYSEGERTGSWDPQVDPWGSAGGRVYATAINTLTMEVFYRYDTVLGSH